MRKGLFLSPLAPELEEEATLAAEGEVRSGEVDESSMVAKVREEEVQARLTRRRVLSMDRR